MTVYRLYVGTYTTGDSEGIYIYQFDPGTGALRRTGVAADRENPSFLALHPSGRYLYAANETKEFRGELSGAVSAYAIDPESGSLTRLNQQPSLGAHPCHVVVDESGRHLLVANYTGGSVAVLPVLPDGSLGEPSHHLALTGSGPNSRRQEGPHPHSVNLGAGLVFVPDLGVDKLRIYRLDGAAGRLAPAAKPHVQVQPGAGPRHMAFHPGGRFAYLINELDSTITVLDLEDDQGAPNAIQSVSTLPPGFSGTNICADIHVHPSGRLLFGSNRGHDSIAAFMVNGESGKLTPAGHYPTGGRTPRNFALDPSGAFLLAANQDSDNIVVFRVDQETGALEQVAEERVPRPVCIRFTSA